MYPLSKPLTNDRTRAPPLRFLLSIKTDVTKNGKVMRRISPFRMDTQSTQYVSLSEPVRARETANSEPARNPPTSPSPNPHPDTLPPYYFRSSAQDSLTHFTQESLLTTNLAAGSA